MYYLVISNKLKNTISNYPLVLGDTQENNGKASYDRDMEMILAAAETVLGYFGFDRTVYGSKKSKRYKEMVVGEGIETGKRDIRLETMGALTLPHSSNSIAFLSVSDYDKQKNCTTELSK